MWYAELMDTKPSEIMKFWWEEWDNALWWLFGWKIYVVWANSWIWKTTFVNQISNNVANQWFRVVKYSLEDRMEDMAKEEIFFALNKIRYKEWKSRYIRVKYLCWEYNEDKEFVNYLNKACEILVEKDNLIELEKSMKVWINDLAYLITQESKKWSRLFIIDHLHYFDMEGKERHDLQIQKTMHIINEIARKYNIAIILVAHYKKGSDNDEPSYEEFKDGSSIYQVANIIIQITRDFDDDISTFHITKLRWPIKPFKLETKFDIWTFEYDFKKTIKQKDADSLNWWF